MAAALLSVVQHCSADYLGLMEDHLEGRNIRFSYHRPFTEDGKLPHRDSIGEGLILLGGGPWGSAGGRDVPTLDEEVRLARACLMLDIPVIGIGLGAQILALAADGHSVAAETAFTISQARRTTPDALNGHLPETYPNIIYMRDRPVPPDYATTLAVDETGHPALFQIGDNALGFTGHPGFKSAMAEDLVMEFEESPSNATANLGRSRDMRVSIEDALVRIMTGVTTLTGWMER